LDKLDSMDKHDSAHKATAIALLILALGGIALTWLMSFRLGIVDINFAWRSNLDRTATAAAAGIAFAVSGAVSSNALANTKTHILGFTLVSVVSSLLLLGAFLDWGLALTVIASLTVTAVIYFCVAYALRERKTINLWSALILSICFVLAVLNYVGASTSESPLGSLALWVQGNLYNVGHFSYLALLLSLSLLTWLIAAKSKETPTILLVGLGVGIAGPVFFLGWLVPTLVRKLLADHNENLFLVCCAATGALFVVLADAIPRLLIGGYAPSLAIPISIVSIPLLLWSQRSTTLVKFPSKLRSIFESGFILLWVFGFIYTVTHLTKFASSAS